MKHVAVGLCGRMVLRWPDLGLWSAVLSRFSVLVHQLGTRQAPCCALIRPQGSWTAERSFGYLVLLGIGPLLTFTGVFLVLVHGTFNRRVAVCLQRVASAAPCVAHMLTGLLQPGGIDQHWYLAPLASVVLTASSQDTFEAFAAQASMLFITSTVPVVSAFVWQATQRPAPDPTAAASIMSGLLAQTLYRTVLLALIHVALAVLGGRAADLRQRAGPGAPATGEVGQGDCRWAPNGVATQQEQDGGRRGQGGLPNVAAELAGATRPCGSCSCAMAGDAGCVCEALRAAAISDGKCTDEPPRNTAVAAQRGGPSRTMQQQQLAQDVQRRRSQDQQSHMQPLQPSQRPDQQCLGCLTQQQQQHQPWNDASGSLQPGPEELLCAGWHDSAWLERWLVVTARLADAAVLFYHFLGASRCAPGGGYVAASPHLSAHAHPAAGNSRGGDVQSDSVAARPEEATGLAAQRALASGLRSPLASALTPVALVAKMRCLGMLLVTSWGATVLALNVIWVLWPRPRRPRHAWIVHSVTTALAGLVRAVVLVLLAAPPTGEGSGAAAGLCHDSGTGLQLRVAGGSSACAAGSSTACGASVEGQGAVAMAAMLLIHLTANNLTPTSYGVQSAIAAVAAAVLHSYLEPSLHLVTLVSVYGSMWLTAAVLSYMLARTYRQATATAAAVAAPAVPVPAGTAVPSAAAAAPADDTAAASSAAAAAAALALQDEHLQALFGPDASASAMRRVPPLLLAQALMSTYSSSLDSSVQGSASPSIPAAAAAAASATANDPPSRAASMLASPKWSAVPVPSRGMHSPVSALGHVSGAVVETDSVPSRSSTPGTATAPLAGGTLARAGTALSPIVGLPGRMASTGHDGAGWGTPISRPPLPSPQLQPQLRLGDTSRVVHPACSLYKRHSLDLPPASSPMNPHYLAPWRLESAQLQPLPSGAATSAAAAAPAVPVRPGTANGVAWNGGGARGALPSHAMPPPAPRPSRYGKGAALSHMRRVYSDRPGLPDMPSALVPSTSLQYTTAVWPVGGPVHQGDVAELSSPSEGRTPPAQHRVHSGHGAAQVVPPPPTPMPAVIMTAAALREAADRRLAVHGCSSASVEVGEDVTFGGSRWVPTPSGLSHGLRPASASEVTPVGTAQAAQGGTLPSVAPAGAVLTSPATASTAGANDQAVLSSIIYDADIYDKLLSSASSPFLLNPTNVTARLPSAANTSTLPLPSPTGDPRAPRGYFRNSSGLSDASCSTYGAAALQAVALQASAVLPDGGTAAIPASMTAAEYAFAAAGPASGARSQLLLSGGGGGSFGISFSASLAEDDDGNGDMLEAGTAGCGVGAGGAGGGGSRPKTRLAVRSGHLPEASQREQSARQVIVLADGRQVYQSETLAAAASVFLAGSSQPLGAPYASGRLSSSSGKLSQLRQASPPVREGRFPRYGFNPHLSEPPGSGSQAQMRRGGDGGGAGSPLSGSAPTWMATAPARQPSNGGRYPYPNRSLVTTHGSVSIPSFNSMRSGGGSAGRFAGTTAPGSVSGSSMSFFTAGAVTSGTSYNTADTGGSLSVRAAATSAATGTTVGSNSSGNGAASSYNRGCIDLGRHLHDTGLIRIGEEEALQEDDDDGGGGGADTAAATTVTLESYLVAQYAAATGSEAGVRSSSTASRVSPGSAGGVLGGVPDRDHRGLPAFGSEAPGMAFYGSFSSAACTEATLAGSIATGTSGISGVGGTANLEFLPGAALPRARPVPDGRTSRQDGVAGGGSGSAEPLPHRRRQPLLHQAVHSPEIQSLVASATPSGSSRSQTDGQRCSTGLLGSAQYGSGSGGDGGSIIHIHMQTHANATSPFSSGSPQMPQPAAGAATVAAVPSLSGSQRSSSNPSLRSFADVALGCLLPHSVIATGNQAHSATASICGTANLSGGAVVSARGAGFPSSGAEGGVATARGGSAAFGSSAVLGSSGQGCGDIRVEGLATVGASGTDNGDGAHRGDGNHLSKRIETVCPETLAPMGGGPGCQMSRGSRGAGSMSASCARGAARGPATAGTGALPGALTHNVASSSSDRLGLIGDGRQAPRPTLPELLASTAAVAAAMHTTANMSSGGADTVVSGGSMSFWLSPSSSAAPPYSSATTIAGSHTQQQGTRTLGPPASGTISSSGAVAGQVNRPVHHSPLPAGSFRGTSAGGAAGGGSGSGPALITPPASPGAPSDDGFPSVMLPSQRLSTNMEPHRWTPSSWLGHIRGKRTSTIGSSNGGTVTPTMHNAATGSGGFGALSNGGGHAHAPEASGQLSARVGGSGRSSQQLPRLMDDTARLSPVKGMLRGLRKKLRSGMRTLGGGSGGGGGAEG